MWQLDNHSPAPEKSDGFAVGEDNVCKVDDSFIWGMVTFELVEYLGVNIDVWILRELANHQHEMRVAFWSPDRHPTCNRKGSFVFGWKTILLADDNQERFR